MLVNRGDPAGNAAVITPNDDEDLPNLPVSGFVRGIYVGTAGDLAVVIGGTSITFSNVAAGLIYPLQVTRVLDTGTTATDLIALW